MAQRVAAKAEANRSCTQLWRMSSSFTLNSEQIDLTAEPPWQRSKLDDDIQERFHIHIPPNIPGKSPKDEWAENHKLVLLDLELDPTSLLVYTDGSLSFSDGIRHTGWGYAIYNCGILIQEDKGALGRFAEVYDAEMEALSSSIEAVSQLIDDPDDKLEIQKIFFFSDNTGAIQRIFDGTPGKAQDCSFCFRKCAFNLLDSDPALSITIKWAPGHFDIEGNDRADSLAKEGSFSIPINPDWHSISFTGSLVKRQLLNAWTQRWQTRERHLRSGYTTADHFPPQLSPTSLFSELSHPIFSRVFQIRTGHAFMGSYYAKFVPSEDPQCPCDDSIRETREHILLECPRYNSSRDLLGETPEERSVSTLLGTPDGILRLAAFVRASSAFSKDHLPE